MTRRMIIKVMNDANASRWQLIDSYLQHGKWMEGSPPEFIPPQGYDPVSIASEKTTGSTYGTTGWALYENELYEGSKMRISWNKPYGTDPTTCYVDMNSVYYIAKVENEDFGKEIATCDVVISLNKDPYVIDTKTWMSKLSSDTTLNNIMMPGSHDAGMSELHHCSIGAGVDNTQTQQYNIKGQLEAGSRYFDIRVDYDHDALVTYHRTGPLGCNGQFFDEVLNQMVSFLEAYKSEVAILKISHIRGDKDDTKQRIYDVLTSSDFDKYLFKSPDVNLAHIKLGDAAGKMIVVLDYDYDIDSNEGMFRYHDGFVDKVCEYRGLNITVCDLYSNTDDYDKMAADQISKWDAYGGLGKNYLFLLSWTLTAGVLGSIRALAEEANGNLPGVLKRQIVEQKRGKPNIVYIDYVNVITTIEIIKYNFM